MDQRGYTPLVYAVLEGPFMPVIEYLVERGADMEAQNRVYDTIAHATRQHIT